MSWLLSVSLDPVDELRSDRGLDRLKGLRRRWRLLLGLAGAVRTPLVGGVGRRARLVLTGRRLGGDGLEHGVEGRDGLLGVLDLLLEGERVVRLGGALHLANQGNETAALAGTLLVELVESLLQFEVGFGQQCCGVELLGCWHFRFLPGRFGVCSQAVTSVHRDITSPGWEGSLLVAPADGVLRRTWRSGDE